MRYECARPLFRHTRSMDRSLLRTSFVKVRLLRSAALWLWLAGSLGPAATKARAEVSEACVASYENAQEQRLSGRYIEAKQNLLVCAQTSCPALLQRDCTSWLSELEASTPTVVFAVTDTQGIDLAGVRIYENGQLLEKHAVGRALALDPGAHTLRFEAEGHEPVEQTLTVREAEKNRIVRAELRALSGPSKLRKTWSRLSVPTRVLAVSSVVSAGLFVGFAIDGRVQYNKLEDECGTTCQESRTDRGRRDYVIADVALGTSLALAAATLWSHFVLDRPEKPQTTALRVNVSPAHAGLTMDHRF